MNDDFVDVVDARPVREVVASDPLFILLGTALCRPEVLGFACAILIVLMILLGPSTDSRFIYTDF